MKNLVCTVVAKNYLAIAETLGDSIKKNWEDAEFIIILSDENDGYIDLSKEPYSIKEAKEYINRQYLDMAFKYNVIEFSTAVKPFVFQELFKEYECDNLFYIDPDMYVFRPLDEVVEALKSHDVVLTPHIVDRNGNTPFFEREALGDGVYNLGFIAFRRSDNALGILRWWQEHLVDQCYLSHREFLFYDQKWMNLLPVFFENVHVLKSKAYNIARWNFGERNISIENNIPFVKEANGDNNRIALFHFSGYKPGMSDFGIGEIVITDEQKNIYWELYKTYGENVKKNNFEVYIKMPYKYDKYENGDLIIQLHRRLYRVLSENSKYDNPFSCNGSSYWMLMKKNKMLLASNDDSNYKTSTSKKMNRFEKKLGILDKCMGCLRKIVGIKNYTMLLKYFSNYCYDERQLFLIKDK